MNGEDYQAVAPFRHDPGIQLIMCNRCGSLVFDMTAHESIHPKAKAEKRESCPSCGNWTVSNNRCNGCRKPFMQCDCRGSERRR